MIDQLEVVGSETASDSSSEWTWQLTSKFHADVFSRPKLKVGTPHITVRPPATWILEDAPDGRSGAVHVIVGPPHVSSQPATLCIRRQGLG